MPFYSSASSVDAQNGSAYSLSNGSAPGQEQHPGSTAADSTAEARYAVGSAYGPAATTTTQSVQYPLTNRDEYQLHNGHTARENDGIYYTNGDQSHFASPYDGYPPSEQHSDHPHSQQDYLPPTSYAEPPNYDSEIVIDSTEEDQAAAHHPAQSTFGSARPRRQARARLTNRGEHRASREQTPPAGQTSQASHVPHSPTARRWSREYSPEERMRLGYARWETEKHRLDYERQQRQGDHRS